MWGHFVAFIIGLLVVIVGVIIKEYPLIMAGCITCLLSVIYLVQKANEEETGE